MPISAEQWRATTGSLNACKTLTTARPKALKLWRCRILPAGSLRLSVSSWKCGYITALTVALLCIPLLYNMYLAVMYQIRGEAKKSLGDSGLYLPADIGLKVLLYLMNVKLYAAMVMAVVLTGAQDRCHKEKDNKHYQLCQKLHQSLLTMDFRFWVTRGSDCEAIFDPVTWSCYITLNLDSEFPGALQYEVQDQCSICPSSKPAKNLTFPARETVSLFLQVSSIALAMLLLLAGDVERNPGPLPRGLTLQTLTIELSPAKSKWHEIGIQLQIGISDLSTIEQEHRRVDRRLSEMLNFWLNKNTKAPICWHSIVDALKCPTVNETRLADELHKKYCCFTESTERDEETSRKRPLFTHQAYQGEDVTVTAECSQSDGARKMLENDSPETKKHKYTFPYLNLSEYNEVEANLLQMQLCKDYDSITKSFQELINTITKSIKERDIKVIEILNSVSQFNTLKPVNDVTILGRPVIKFEDQFPKLLIATSIDEFMFNIREYSSFFSYGLIQQIIENLGTKEDKAKLLAYEKHFQEYACHTVLECPELGIPCSEGRTPFLVKVHKEGFERCSIDHLMRFINYLSEIFAQCHDGMILLESVTPGCLELTLHIPQSVFTTIFPLSPQQERALKDLGVIEISAGDYQYPPSQDADDGDLDHKDDRPDDGPSDTGYDTLSTIMSELSEFKQSIADRDLPNPYEIEYDSMTKPSSIKKQHANIRESITPLHTASRLGKLDEVKVLVETNTFNPLQRDSNGDTALHYAVEGRHLDALKYFIEVCGCNSTTAGAFGETPLHLAARKGYIEIVKYLVLEQTVDPTEDEENRFGMPLHSACIGGNLEVIKFLVNELKAFLPIKQIFSYSSKVGATPLMLAIQYGHIEVVKLCFSEFQCDPDMPVASFSVQNKFIEQSQLLDCLKETNQILPPSKFLTLPQMGQQLNQSSQIQKYMHTAKTFVSGKRPLESKPLHVAALENQVEIMKYLINECNCTPSQPDNYNGTPVHYAAAGGSLNALTFLVLENGCDVTSANELNETPIHLAAGAGNLHILKFLILEVDCDPNVINVIGATPLHTAAYGGQIDTMSYLIENYNCDPLLSTCYGKVTPLHAAISGGNLNAVKFLVELIQRKHGITLADDATFLIQAATMGYLEILKFLITKLKFDPNIADEHGITALHLAAQNSHVEVIRYLVCNAKCNPLPLDYPLKTTPLHHAAMNGPLEAVQILTSGANCELNCKDGFDNVPLHYAVMAGHLEIVKFFISELNCDPNIPGFGGSTPLHLAMQCGHLTTVDYLINIAKCDPFKMNYSGQMPFHVAAMSGQVEAIKTFLSSVTDDCDPNIEDALGMTPLQYAVYCGHLNVTQFYIETLGCPPEQLNSSTGLSLTEVAVDMDHWDIVQYLQAALHVKIAVYTLFVWLNVFLFHL